MLRQLNDLLLENQEDIARLIVAENGKPCALLWPSGDEGALTHERREGGAC